MEKTRDYRLAPPQEDPPSVTVSQIQVPKIGSDSANPSFGYFRSSLLWYQGGPPSGLIDVRHSEIN